MKPKDEAEQTTTSDNPNYDPVAVLDAIMDCVALEHAESTEVFTPSEDRWARKLRQEIDRELAAMRRQLTPSQPRYKRFRPIPEDLLKLERDALIARLTSLRQASSVRYAHQDLRGLTNDDLRQLIVAISEPPHEE